MKKIAFIFAILALGNFSLQAHTAKGNGSVEVITTRNVKNFIFEEDGITFSVFADGEFDFYINREVNINAHVRIGNVGLTFNSGYDYNPYVQYDDYGAVIQVEDIPVYYDYYGRVSQIGSVRINYRRNRIHTIGGLTVFYDNRGYYRYCDGYINVYNRYYTYRPYYDYFARPTIAMCMVYDRPYRRYYSPIRYTYYSPYRYNYRRTYYDVGRHYNYYSKSPNYSRRGSIYKNDHRVVKRDRGRSNSYTEKHQRSYDNGKYASRSSKRNTSKNDYNRKGSNRSNSYSSNRSSSGRSSAHRSSSQRSNTPKKEYAAYRTKSNNRSSANRSSSYSQRSSNSVKSDRVTKTRSQSNSYSQGKTRSTQPKARSQSNRSNSNRATASRSSRNSGQKNKNTNYGSRSSRSSNTKSASRSNTNSSKSRGRSGRSSRNGIQ
ncbi:hypothetical protein [Sediminicola luteus]|uniref:Uncharacterized protein n=1 Tax=Sediminicola luteus TaxID=319238 RepID=A0A2A4G7X3_9FLAO|nr:hypothetical protein [Sediminicola luteus]PCE63852.1 hypothetical protein B7P33_11320 [Sediminicola luteus]